MTDGRVLIAGAGLAGRVAAALLADAALMERYARRRRKLAPGTVQATAPGPSRAAIGATMQGATTGRANVRRPPEGRTR